MEGTITASTPQPSFTERLKNYVDFARPFTLVAPMLGIISGGITAWGAAPVTSFHWSIVFSILAGGLMAAMLNVASNGINQVFDLPIDRINKPSRPIPSGKMSIREAWAVSLAAYVVAWILAWVVVPSEPLSIPVSGLS